MTFIWRNRSAAEEVPEEVDPVVESAAVDRLRRVVGRVDRTDAPEAHVEAAPAPGRFADSQLAGNAFAMLGVGIEASADTINDAVDALSFEPGQDPDALNAARAKLMSARDRLGEELGWLPELSPERLAQVRAGLAAGDAAKLAAARDATTGLARLNLSLALAIGVPGDLAAATRIIVDGQAWDVEATLELLDDARFRAGFRPIERDVFDRAVQARAESIAQTLAPLFAASTSARNALTAAMQAASTEGGGFAAAFLDEVLRCYAAGIDPALEQAHARIKVAIEALDARPDDNGQAIALIAGLEIWSSLRRPVQVHEAARGLDDPASAAIFKSVRDLTVKLSNEHDQFDIALRLARALIASFALVPSRRSALERELPTLVGNALFKRIKQICDVALSEHRAFAAEVMAGGLEKRGGLAGHLVAVFDDAMRTVRDSDRDAYFLAVRGLAVDLHNNHRERRAALAITEWLFAQDPPPEIRERLAGDLAQLRGEPARSTVVVPRAPDAPRPGGFGRANPGSAGTAAPSASAELPWGEAPPPNRPAPPPEPRKRRGWTPLSVAICTLLALSYCSARLGAPRHVSEPFDARERAGQNIPRAPVSSRSAREAIEERLRRAETRMGNPPAEAPAQPVYIPGRPMVDARPASEIQRSADTAAGGASQPASTTLPDTAP